MKIMMMLSVILLISLLIQTSWADTPEISSPPDQTIEQGKKGTIVWTVVCEKGDTYTVSGPGVHEEGPLQCKSGSDDIHISVDTTMVGIWHYIISANDTAGNSASDQVNITVIDITPPIISHPDDQTIEQDAEEYITWNIIEDNPGEYQILRNESPIVTSTYQNKEDIEISIDSSELGIWNYTIRANDTSGNTASDQVLITVVDTTGPVISGPDDIIIAQNATGNIEWHILEKNPGEFRILINGEEIGDSAPYQNDAQISIPVNTFIPGNSNYRIIAEDTSGNTAFDDVAVTVIAGLENVPPSITGPEDQTIEQDSYYVLTWNIIEDNPKSYRIMQNGVTQEVSSYTNGSDINFSVDTETAGSVHYSLEANDTSENTATHEVTISIEMREPPTITGDAEMSVERGAAGNIIVHIFDLSPAYYWVLRNATTVSQPSRYVSGDVSIPIDTTTAGTYNYTIFANDTFGDVSNHLVTVTIIQSPPSSSGGGSSGSEEESSSSGGGSSGGGGGGTGENHFNIALYENNRQYVHKNQPVMYDFSNEGNIVTSFSFTGLTKAGKILAKIEILKATSSLVTADPPAEIYKNFNLWCGYEGWFSGRTVANPTLEFTVEKSWVKENNIIPDSINLQKFNTDSWAEISTRMADQDSLRYYYIADLPVEPLGPMAVSGKKERSSTINPEPTMSIDILNFESLPESGSLSTRTSWNELWAQSIPGFKGIGALFILLTSYIIFRRYAEK